MDQSNHSMQHGAIQTNQVNYIMWKTNMLFKLTSQIIFIIFSWVGLYYFSHRDHEATFLISTGEYRCYMKKFKGKVWGKKTGMCFIESHKYCCWTWQELRFGLFCGDFGQHTQIFFTSAVLKPLRNKFVVDQQCEKSPSLCPLNPKGEEQRSLSEPYGVCC